MEIPEKVEKKPSTSVVCKNCNKENDIKNEACVYCDEDLFDEPKKQCPICSFKVKQKNYEAHYLSCLLTKETLEKEAEEEKRLNEEMIKKEIDKVKNDMEECIHCRQKVHPSNATAHQAACRGKGVNELVFDEKTRMTPLQIQAMKHMN